MTVNSRESRLQTSWLQIDTYQEQIEPFKQKGIFGGDAFLLL
jgi:hypothetical protein